MRQRKHCLRKFRRHFMILVIILCTFWVPLSLNAQSPADGAVTFREEAESATALGNIDGAIHLYYRLLHHEPDNVESSLALMNLLIAQRRYKEVEREIAKALALSPKNPDLWLMEGLLQAQLGDEQQAAIAYDNAALHGSDDAIVQGRVAGFFQSRGNLSKAEARSQRYKEIIASQSSADGVNDAR